MLPAALNSHPASPVRGRPSHRRAQLSQVSTVSSNSTTYRERSPLAPSPNPSHQRQPSPLHGTPLSQLPSPPRYSSPYQGRRPSPAPTAGWNGSQNTFVFNGISSTTDPFLISKKTTSAGPTKREPALITSKWGVGWQTLTLMLVCYVLAFTIALAHLILFQYINGRDAGGINQVISQGTLATTSNILSNAFGFAIRASLALAFVQYLWRLLRLYAMKVSTIETLFSIRANPFLLLKPAAVVATPLLCGLAVLIWASQFATSLPPGAITVITIQQTSYSNVTVPSFNASFMGNGSGYEANYYSLIRLDPLYGTTSGFTSGLEYGTKDGNALSYLARRVLVTSSSFMEPSPCGANCSYITEFEGPYMYCNQSSGIGPREQNGSYWNAFQGIWNNPLSQPNNPALHYYGNVSVARFNTTCLKPLGGFNKTQVTLTNGTSDIETAQFQTDFMACAPGRARYIINNTFINNVQTRNYTIEPISWLVNMVTQSHSNIVPVPGFMALNGTADLGIGPANWNSFALDYYRDNNMLAITGAMVSWLQGEFIASISGSNDTLWWEEDLFTNEYGAVKTDGAQGGTIIDSTRFDAAYGVFDPTNQTHPSFNVTPSLLNEYLFNLTLSTMKSYGFWNTTVNATLYTATNIYSFSQPLALILPYFITLTISLPFIILGIIALYHNGVSATDGSFTQILTTTTGSSTLSLAAAGGCLGGSESTPQELKDLKIRFGEFVGRDEPGGGVKRAGFGVDEEIQTLRKDVKYGVARWI